MYDVLILIIIFTNNFRFSFSMFHSLPPYHDLIFQDATRQLQMIPIDKQRYDLYLGGDFMRARRITDCQSGANQLKFNYLVILMLSLLFYFTQKTA